MALFAFALALAGCEQLAVERAVVAAAPLPLPPPPPVEPDPVRREVTMNRQWQNHRYSELLAVLGTPTMVMNIPGGGNPPGFAVVFQRDPLSGCVDAFAMVYASDPIVRQYHCR